MVFIVARGTVSSNAKLSANGKIVTNGNTTGFTISPSVVTNMRGQLYVMCLLGGYTTWDANTSWTIRTNGPSLTASVFGYGSPVFTAWAFTLGPGSGTITLSNGLSSAVLTVL